MRTWNLSYALLACVAAFEAVAQDPDPKAILDAAIAQAGEWNTVSADLSLEVKLESGDQNDVIKVMASFVLQDKNKAYMHILNPREEAEVFSDGETQTIYISEQKVYRREPAPESRAPLLGVLLGGPLRPGPLWLGRFLEGDATLSGDLSEYTYLGQERLDAADTHHLKAVHEDYDIECWIGVKSGLLQRFQLDVGRMFEKAGQGEMKATLDFKLVHWDSEGVVDPERFVFTPPEGARPFEQVVPQEPADPMTGKPAPELKLPLLDGGTADLAAHKGKEIVVLDFWATWCKPCRIGLPIIVKVAAEFEGKDVIFYAVNLKETPEMIAPFLAESGLELRVALDKEGASGLRYGAASIPRTVIIDKAGIVRHVHRGVSPGLEDRLRSELSALATEK